MIKVMIADDQELIRQSLQIVLEMKEGIEVTATAKDGREVIQKWMECNVHRSSKNNIQMSRSLF